MKLATDQRPALFTSLDLRIALCVLICFLVPTVLSQLGVTFAVGEAHLEIIQRLTACFACLLCCQEGLDESRHASVTRLIITAVGGLVGMLVVGIDMALGSNPWVLTLLVSLGTIATLVACKAVGVPYVNARIGALTFLLVASMLAGTARLWYALFRFLSTLFGAVVVVLVTWLLGPKGTADAGRVPRHAKEG